MSAREEILGRIRRALRDVPDDERPADVPVGRDYRRERDGTPEEILALFEQRVSDYAATVRSVAAGEVGAAVTAACRELGLDRVVVPPELPRPWRPEGVEVVVDDGLSAAELDAIDGALTGCAVAIAETGTLALDGRGRSGRRAATLVPDHHICVVEAGQVVGSVPEAIARLAAAVSEHRAPVTLVSGPSATSDIELSRVEGVHGPRSLLVLLAR
jgi:L-lactate dehydrogenase complex protein LldG